MLHDSKVHLTYIGHATLLIELNGVRLLTDPVLRGRVAHLRHRQPPVRIEPFHSIDAVLISHLHFDHLDLPSLRKLGRPTRFIVPHGTGQWLQQQGFEWVEEVRPDDVVNVQGVQVRATHAQHGKRRHPFGLQAHTLGYVVDGSQRLYFAGDTDLFPEMQDLADNLDLALLPVWGWGPTLGKGHLNPERAAQALQLLRPRLAVPIHWGCLHPVGIGWLNPNFLHRPPHEFVAHAARLAPQVKTHILHPGDSLLFEESGIRSHKSEDFGELSRAVKSQKSKANTLLHS